ncbi:hypothetical protein A2U01_0058552, partial [Trifolium medium]|nr:hypothetical protein [Trifolium medium]
VKSGYKLVVNNILTANRFNVPGEWNNLRIKAPPKARHFLWRVCKAAYLHVCNYKNAICNVLQPVSIVQMLKRTTGTRIWMYAEL